MRPRTGSGARPPMVLRRSMGKLAGDVLGSAIRGYYRAWDGIRRERGGSLRIGRKLKLFLAASMTADFGMRPAVWLTDNIAIQGSFAGLWESNTVLMVQAIPGSANRVG